MGLIRRLRSGNRRLITKRLRRIQLVQGELLMRALNYMTMIDWEKENVKGKTKRRTQITT
jgi:hypothetical protein